MSVQAKKTGKVVLMFYAAGMFVLAAAIEMFAWYKGHNAVSAGMGAMFFGVGAMWIAIGTVAKKKEARDNAGG